MFGGDEGAAAMSASITLTWLHSGGAERETEGRTCAQQQKQSSWSRSGCEDCCWRGLSVEKVGEPLSLSPKEEARLAVACPVNSSLHFVGKTISMNVRSTKVKARKKMAIPRRKRPGVIKLWRTHNSITDQTVAHARKGGQRAL